MKRLFFFTTLNVTVWLTKLMMLESNLALLCTRKPRKKSVYLELLVPTVMLEHVEINLLYKASINSFGKYWMFLSIGSHMLTMKDGSEPQRGRP